MSDKIPSHLIIRYLANEASAEEQEELLEWVSQEEAHQKIFHEYSELWKRKDPAPHAFDLSKGLQHLDAKLDAIEKEERATVFTYWRKLAATVTLLIIAGTAIMLSWTLLTPGTKTLVYQEQSTTDQKISIQLADGSTVQLNAGSSLKYPEHFSQSTREVYLTGEAFFTVTKDPSKPFIVHTGNITTQVLGTSFNINTQSDRIVVAVATGKVNVSDGVHSETLLPRNKAIYHSATATLEQQPANLDRELAWMNNTIIFEDTDLLSATQTLAQRYGVTITFEHEAIKKCVITGTFKNESLQHILEAIEFSTGIRHQFHDKKVDLFGKGCE